MQATRTALLVLTALCASLGLGPTLSAQKISYTDFESKVAQFVRLDDTRQLARLVKDNPDHSIGYQGNLVRQMRNEGGGSEANVKIRDMMESAFTDAFGSPTPLRRVQEWAETASPEKLAQFDSARTAYRDAAAAVNELDANKVTERKPWEDVHESIRNVGRAIEDSGHMILAAEVFTYAAGVRNRIPRRRKNDLEEVLLDVEKFLSLREAWRHTEDPTYLQNKGYVGQLRDQLKEAEKPAAGGREEPVDRSGFLGSEGGTVPMTEGHMKKVDDAMSFQSGTRPLEWLSISIDGEGPSALWQVPDRSLHLVRPKAAEIGVTLDGKETDLSKNPFVPVEMSSRVRDPSSFELSGETYWMWFFVGGTQETRYGIQQNLAPTAESMTVFYRSAMEWSFEVDGTEVAIFDDNTDFRAAMREPATRTIQDRHQGDGPTTLVEVPSLDSMRIGRGDLQPFSNWMKVGSDWIYVELNGEDSIGWTKADPDALKTGFLELDWKGNRKNQPTAFIVQGEGPFSNAFFDLSSGKPVEVPAGRYHLLYGHIVSGKGARALTARLGRGTSESFDVVDGETVELPFGGPFRLDYTRKVEGEDVVIAAASLRVRGIAGEIYTHLDGGIVPEVEVLTARDDQGRGARPVGEFRPLQSAEEARGFAELIPDLGVESGYYPVPQTDGDPAPGLTVEGGAVKLVGLREKKNKLFGKLDPIWK